MNDFSRSALYVSLLVFSFCRYAHAVGTEDSIDFMEGYWSHYFMFSPAPYDPGLLRKKAENDPKFAETLKKRKIDLNKPQKRWPFYYKLGYSVAPLFLDYPPPPDNWTSAEFDDSLWPRHILPQLTGRTCWKSQTTGLACFRARFIADNPDSIDSLTVSARFRGGIILYVNGREIGRAGLPRGKIDACTPAEPYPADAYVLPRLKIGNYDSRRRREVTELIGEFPGPNHWIRYNAAHGLFKKEPITDLAGMGRKNRVVITRKEWKKIQSLRERELCARVPKACLRKGVNVVCAEIHRSTLRPDIPVHWLHAYFTGLTAECSPAGSVRREARGEGIRIWTDDIHRRYFEKEYGPAGERISPIRIAAVQNGTFSGQMIIGTDREVTSLKVRVSNLSGPGGAIIPADAVMMRYAQPHSMNEIGIKKLSANAQGGRGIEGRSIRLAKTRYAPDIRRPGGLRRHEYRKWRKKILSGIRFFDHLSHKEPESIDRDTCRPVWITVNVPASAEPGTYTGTVHVTASRIKTEVPVLMQVMDWKLPDPEKFHTVMGLEPSPYGVSGFYGVKPWSDRHFGLMKNTFRLMAELDNDLVIIPVILYSEFGNKGDSMIKWRKNPKGYECDLSLLKRFLACVKKHSDPSCICLAVSRSSKPYGQRGKPDRVLVVDDAGSAEEINIPAPGSPKAASFWKPFVKSVKGCFSRFGFEKRLHWGFLGDNLKGNIKRTVSLFKELSPETGWARGAHGWGGPKTGYSFSTTVRHASSPFDRRKRNVVSRKGWKREWNRLVFTRVENGVSVVYGFSSPLRYRIAPERAVICGCNGIGRWGLDYWAGTYTTWGNITPTVLSILWPGPEGAEAGVRYECLREGLQEVEARVFLEKKLENKDFAESETGKQTQEILDRRIKEQFIQVIQSADNNPQPKIEEYYFGWQQSSWDLYAAAAEASGGRAPRKKERRAFFGETDKSIEH